VEGGRESNKNFQKESQCTSRGIQQAVLKADVERENKIWKIRAR